MFLLILWEGCLHVHVNLTFTGKSLILKPCENHLYCRLEVIVFVAMRSEQTVPWHLLMIVKLSIVKITLENGVADFKGLKFLSFNRVFVCLFVCVFVCLGFYVSIENKSVIWRRLDGALFYSHLIIFQSYRDTCILCLERN